MPGPYSPKDQTAPAPQPSAPPAYIPERDSNEVNPEALPPAYSDDVSCSAGMKRSQHRLCLLFTLGLLVLILLRVLAEVGALPEDDADNLRDPVIFFPVLAGLYIIYLIECSCSSTRAFTHNKTTEPDALVNAVHGNPPTIYFSIQVRECADVFVCVCVCVCGRVCLCVCERIHAPTTHAHTFSLLAAFRSLNPSSSAITTRRATAHGPFVIPTATHAPSTTQSEVRHLCSRLGCFSL